MTIDRPLLVVIAGSTAVGKTGLAISLANAFQTEILSADSRQFYREMSIGTAVPTPEQLSKARHHFIHHLSIRDSYNVSRFESDALSLLDDLFIQYPVVIMAGGSGLYIDAVCNGIDALPDPDPDIRQELRSTLASGGTPALMEILQKLDPVYSARVDKANPVRLIRAIEVCRITGRPYSTHLTKTSATRPFRICKVGLRLTMDELTVRINDRLTAMMAAGWYEEALSLFPYRHLNALRTVGYRELFDHLEGLCTLDYALEKIRVNTRRYAKRQLTWFERDKEYTWFRPDESGEITRFIRQAL
ncbi:MAG TPA: tRNA (adenosine(37)-N6)-dimethylallyltransferase MiaA [Bacteroidales bacterium]|nr:tRNA (adenosine(37)-N6)-dimethylallyltransferase MiaA [Bacteroidales bacterium]HPS61503.1 tRNA (adenosine(37)-N6)-dimethylallyltransferase MiaA [Bacteroidales bacterium]